MPDPKPKKLKKQFSKDPDDVKASVERDYPGYKARYLGKSPEGRSEFEMRSSTGKTFTMNRAQAFPGVDKEEASKAKEKYYRNRSK